MHVITIDAPDLGDRSYLISEGSTAVVVDPQRDIDRIMDLLDDRGLRLALVCETHIHNDYVTGGLVLSRLRRADYAVSGDDDVCFDRRPVADDTVIDLGDLTVRALHTPGHTPTHMSYVLSSADGTTAVFTGGSMLYGTVGRTDLISADMTERLTREQYRSVRRVAAELPQETAVWPTHGFGSFCASAGGGERSEGTIADEREENLACVTDDEDRFVAELLDGLTAHPPYYRHMGPLNLAGPLMPDLSPPRIVGPEELSARIDRGEWVVDVRSAPEFAENHLVGTVSIDASGAFVTYLGWTLPWGLPITLVGDDEDQIARAQREMVRIGIDRPMGMAVGGPDVYAKGQDLGSYPRRTFADLSAHPDATVVDVRRSDEWDAGHIEGAIHLPLERVAEEASTLPDARLWVHCASGYRASIGASLVAAAGKDVVYIDDEFDNVADSRRTVVG